MEQGVVLVDYIHEFTEPLNEMFRDKENAVKNIIITSNILLIIVVVNAMFVVLKNGRVFRWITAIIWLLIYRILFDIMFKLPVPIGYSFSYPGIPPIVVKYITVKGFWFSG